MRRSTTREADRIGEVNYQDNHAPLTNFIPERFANHEIIIDFKPECHSAHAEVQGHANEPLNASFRSSEPIGISRSSLHSIVLVS